MIKKFVYTLACAVMAFGFAACSSDEPLEGVSGPEGRVSFTAQLPAELGSRAVGDGKSATTLQYAVYDSATGQLILQNFRSRETDTYINDAVSFTNLVATVDFQLVTGNTYDIVFFARSSKAYNFCSFDPTTKLLTINYNEISNSYSTDYENYDIFYKKETVTVTGALNKTVELKRPVAQLNFGTNDYAAPAVERVFGENLRSLRYQLASDSELPTTLNLLDGTLGDYKKIETKMLQPRYLINNDQFPVEGDYKYMSMTYVLVGAAERTVADLKLTINNSSSNTVNVFEITNVPLQANYRTNVYGSLLSSTVTYKVEIDNSFGTPDIDNGLWFGEVKEPVADADGNYTISTAAELAGIAKIVNSGNDLKGKTVKLAKSISLCNLPWTPIGSTTDKPFRGTFDGCGNTISDLKVTISGPSQPAGFIGCLHGGGVLKDLTIDGADINALGATTAAARGTAVAVGHAYTAKIMENVTVKNAKVKAYRWAGGIAGYNYGTIKGCHAENIEIDLSYELVNGVHDNCDKGGAICGLHNEGDYILEGNSAKNVVVRGYRHVGGLFGLVNYDVTVRNNTITGGDVYQKFDYNYYPIEAGTRIGEIWGELSSNALDGGANTATDVTVHAATIAATVEAIPEAIAKGGYVYVDGDAESYDISSQGTIEITNPTVISVAAGKTLTVASNQFINNSELTLDGEGAISGTGFVINNNKGASLTINNGTYISVNTSSYGSPVYTEGNLTVNGGNFMTLGGSEAIRVNMGNITDKGTTVVINGGTFSATNNYAVNFYGGNTSVENKFYITGGTFIGASGCARADGNVECHISGGTFIAKGQYHGFCAGAESYGSDKCKAYITGGKFWANGGGSAIKANQAQLFISGGEFNKAVTALADGFECVDLVPATTVSVDGTDYTFGKTVRPTE